MSVECKQDASKPKRGRPKKQLDTNDSTTSKQTKPKRKREESVELKPKTSIKQQKLTTGTNTGISPSKEIATILLHKEQERNFAKWFTEIEAIRIKATLLRKTWTTTEEWAVFAAKHYTTPVHKYLSLHPKGVLRLIPGYENVFCDFCIFRHPSNTYEKFSWPNMEHFFRLFVRNDVFYDALLKFRRLHLCGWYNNWKKDSTFSKYEKIYHAHAGKYFWYDLLNGYRDTSEEHRLPITLSMLMTDPYINEKSTEDLGKQISIVEKASQLGIPTVILSLLARPDFEITQYSLEEMKDERVLNILRTEHKSRQSTYKQLIELVFHECATNNQVLFVDLQLLVIQFVL